MHEFVLFIIMTFNFYLNKNNKIDYFYANANDDKKINFVVKRLIVDDVDNDKFSQICCLYRCEIINDFIEIFVDNNEHKIIDMLLYFKQHFRLFNEIFHCDYVISKCYF